MAYLISILIALIHLTFLIFKILLFKEVSKNFYFLVLSNIIFSIATTSFIFYFNDQIISLISSFFLMIYALFLVLEIKKEIGYVSALSIPYLLFTIVLFIFLTIQVI